MSFEKVLHYIILADSPAYQATIVEYLRRWAEGVKLPKENPLWERLAGKSIYCQLEFWPQEQMQTIKKDHDQARYGHRYTGIHYPWARFKTVECRFLPMFSDVELAISALQMIIKVTNAYLLAGEKRTVKESGVIKNTKTGVSVKLTLVNGDVYEEFVEE